MERQWSVSIVAGVPPLGSDRFADQIVGRHARLRIRERAERGGCRTGEMGLARFGQQLIDALARAHRNPSTSIVLPFATFLPALLNDR